MTEGTDVTHSTAARRGMFALVCGITTLLAFVIASPIALSSQDLVAWAESTAGLGLGHGWALLVFVALDAAAATCVGMVVYAAWRGETAGAFGLLVWAFALGSAVANYRHGRTTPARDDQWFFPAMSLAGPALLEVTVRRVRRWVQTTAGRYERPLPHFRLVRWLPGIALRETAHAWRLAVTEGYSRPEDAIRAARRRVPRVASTYVQLDTFDELDDANADANDRDFAAAAVDPVRLPRREQLGPVTPQPYVAAAQVTRAPRVTRRATNVRPATTARDYGPLIADLRRNVGHKQVAEKHGVSLATVGRAARAMRAERTSTDTQED